MLNVLSSPKLRSLSSELDEVELLFTTLLRPKLCSRVELDSSLKFPDVGNKVAVVCSKAWEFGRAMEAYQSWRKY